MARETKVGLLVGLVFIVCFAVILANRGRQDTLQTQLPFAFVMDHEVLTPVASPDAAPGASSYAAGNPAAPAPQPVSEPAYRQVADARDGYAAPIPVVTGPQVRPQAAAANLPARRTEGLRTDLPTRERALQQLLDQRHAEMTAGAAATRKSASEVSFQPVRGTPLTAVENSVSTSAAPGRVDVPPGSGPAAPLRPSARRHTVVPKDTLSKIALTYYGSRSPRVIDALFEANRDILPQKDMVPLGVELVLPEIADLAATTRHAQRPVESPSRTHRLAAQPADAGAAPGFSWYQIKKNDRYISIAREQLGDERRWREIHEMNKDKFPDPGKIRAGVRIKLPVDAPQTRTTTS